MRDFKDILDKYVNDGDVDLKGCLEEAAEEMGTVPTITGNEMLQMVDEHSTYMASYIGGLALQVAQQAGTLEGSFEEAYENMLLGFEFDKFRRLYELKQKQADPNQLIIPTE